MINIKFLHLNKDIKRPNDVIRGGQYALDDISSELRFDLENLGVKEATLIIHVDKLVKNLPCFEVENTNSSTDKIVVDFLGENRIMNGL